MKYVAPFAAAVALFATSAYAQTAPVPVNPSRAAQAPQERLSSVDKNFLKNVAHGNSFEVRSGKLALQKSQDEKVRMIATMLVKEHGQAQADLMKVGMAHDMKLPSAPNPVQKALIRRMSRLNGDAFNRAFMKAQVDSHYATIATFKKELTNGTDSHVRDFAAKYQPGIENHTNHITSTASRFGVKVAAPGEGRAASAIKPGKANMNGMKGMNNKNMGNMNSSGTGSTTNNTGSSTTNSTGNTGNTNTSPSTTPATQP